MSLAAYRSTPRGIDWVLALLTFALALFGLVMVLSASAYLAGTTGDVYQFVSRQAISLLIGLIAMAVVARIDYRLWRTLAPAIFIIVILFLLGVFVSPECRGVHRCLDLGPVTFQPTEIVKIAFLVYLGAWLAGRGREIGAWRRGVIPLAVLLAFVGGLIMLQPDMGTAIILMVAAVLLYFVAGARLTHLALGGVLAIGLVGLLIFVAPYRLERLQTFLDPASDPLGAGYQTTQIGIAIGSGGLWGLGFGNGKLKYLGYVPEVHTDSIFAVVVEELGFVRSLLVLFVFVWLILRGLSIARAAPDRFGQLLGIAMISLIGIQVLVNLAAMLKLVPLTGVPLPLISYGGSSLVATCIAIGLLLSISRTRHS